MKITDLQIKLINALFKKQCYNINLHQKMPQNGKFPQNQYSYALTSTCIKKLEHFLKVRNITSLENVGYYEKEMLLIGKYASDNGRTLAIIEAFFETAYLTKEKAAKLYDLYSITAGEMIKQRIVLKIEDESIKKDNFRLCNERDYYFRVLELLDSNTD